MSVSQKFWAWAKANHITGQRYAVLYARAVKSPRGRREYSGR